MTRLRFANPVLDREVRSKFRMRQPPLAVIVAEAMLGVLVGGFYLQTLFWALFEPRHRTTIWWGLVFTGLIVTMMAAAVMGGNGFSRERESGTWEGLRLSLLSADEILRGKVVASLLTCALFSLPVWPLLLPCVRWTPSDGLAWRDQVWPFQVVACLLVWGATALSFTLVGLLVGLKQTRSSRASGQTLGLLGALLVALPVLDALWGRMDFGWLAALHPIAAAVSSLAPGDDPVVFRCGLPFLVCHLVLSALLWRITRGALQREFFSAPADAGNGQSDSISVF